MGRDFTDSWGRRGGAGQGNYLLICVPQWHTFGAWLRVLKERKSQRFVARVTAADKQLFQQAAAIEGRSVAKFIIAHVRERAREVIKQSNRIQLDADQSRRFVEALLTRPGQAPASLKKAMVRYRRHVKEA